MKKTIIFSVAMIFCFVCAGILTAAERGEAEAPVTVKTAPGKVNPRANFSLLYGTVTKIDTSDPANVKLEVKNEADNTTHTVELTAATNVTKMTDISELKTGENVRVMARKIDNKEVAMGVMFGKIRKPAPRPMGQAGIIPPAQAAAPSAKQQPKK